MVRNPFHGLSHVFPNHVPNLAQKIAEAHGSRTIRCHHPDGTSLVEQAIAPGAAVPRAARGQ